MDADQAGDFEPQVKRVGDQSILPVEKDAIRPQMRCRPSRLIDTHSRQRKIARFAVAEITSNTRFPCPVSSAIVPPICTSASSGCAEMTMTSYDMARPFPVNVLSG